jgi:hypothetical protein
MKAFLDFNDPESKAGFALNAPSYVDSVELTGTAVQLTVPAGARYVVFSATDHFYAAYGAAPTAVAPSGTTSDGSGSELNPAVRRVDEIAKISVISADALLTLAFYT